MKASSNEEKVKVIISQTKILISKFITQPFAGWLISRFVRNVSYYGVKVKIDNPFLSNSNRAKIFWNLYESAEARLVSKYIRNDYPIIELGSSLGIVSSLIAKNTDNKIICVEANPHLISAIEYNLNYTGAKEFIVLNGGISYSDDRIRFKEDPKNNLNGRITRDEGIDINKITLKVIIENYDIRKYILIADIEGSEVELFSKEGSVLENCQLAILEVHKSEIDQIVYSIEDGINIILNRGFRILERDGNCIVIVNTSSE